MYLASGQRKRDRLASASEVGRRARSTSSAPATSSSTARSLGVDTFEQTATPTAPLNYTPSPALDRAHTLDHVASAAEHLPRHARNEALTATDQGILGAHLLPPLQPPQLFRPRAESRPPLADRALRRRLLVELVGGEVRYLEGSGIDLGGSQGAGLHAVRQVAVRMGQFALPADEGEAQGNGGGVCEVGQGGGTQGCVVLCRFGIRGGACRGGGRRRLEHSFLPARGRPA